MLRHGRADRILFGSDYPYISPKAQLDTFMEVARYLDLPNEAIEKILFSNAQQLFLKK
jgi:predicted TIM-barrel fold metal-dependent hydrolase